ncbi:MAG: carbohydrate-binding domain-containing protein, partial [Clostridia bacterium]|nr:carbohydrate-binding domain-containing protein [Clostridia bacterium]
PTFEEYGYKVYECECGHRITEMGNLLLEHNYADMLSYDETSHWYACTDAGYESLKKGEAEHNHVFKTEIAPTFEEYGYKVYECECGHRITEMGNLLLEHNYADMLSYDETSHWYACTDEGYESLKKDEAEHTDSNERIIKGATDSEAGIAEYACSDCGCVYQKPIYVSSEILTFPTVSGEVYVGQKLSDVSISGGEASVDGSFEWADINTVITDSGKYTAIFRPTLSDVFDSVECEIEITATQLTVTVNSGEGGSANYDGVVNVNYGSSLIVAYTPDIGYDVDMLIIDGNVFTGICEYEFENIRSNRVIEATFVEVIAEDNGGEESNLPYTVTYVSGTQNAYTISGNTVTFTEISEKTVYAISGELDGNIVIDVGDSYKFDLELTGFTLTSSTINPITVLSGDEVSITAKNGHENFVYDKREAIDETDTTLYSASIYSLVDLEICGKGKLEVVSDNNNGIHTKDDLQVKNLTLYVKCKDNALKGNDSVEITEANTTLIATAGDSIKTTNSHINETTLNQKGTVSIAGGTHNLYAACDGIDCAYDVSIADGSTSTVINIYTDRYSEYSEEVTAVSESTYYLRYTSTAYKYSVKYYNSDTDYLWVNVSDDYKTVSSGRNTYYYYTFAKKSEYSQFAVYMYSSSQTQGQDSDYYACSSYKTLNDSYDTVALSYRSGSLSVSWTNYTTSSMPGGMGGGMSEGNSDKGDYSTKGIKASNSISIAGGTVNIQAYDDAIHANNDVALENGEAPLGNVTVSGGIVTAYSHDDGVHADGTLLVSGGALSVTKSYEGIEGAFIIISGGAVSVISSDDGFNGTSTTGASITISGGNVYVYATGDGIDSNSTTSKGAIVFSGGNTVVICNSNGNASIDSDGGYNHTGGRVLALMTSGGMTNEATNGNTTGRKTASLSLTANNYATVTVDSTLTVAVKMPCSLSAFAVYLGSSSASISSSSSVSEAVDANGVYFF